MNTAYWASALLRTTDTVDPVKRGIALRWPSAEQEEERCILLIVVDVQ